jgi:hypothetical protein
MKNRWLLLTAIALAISAFSADFSVYEANYPGVQDYNVQVEYSKLTVVPKGAYVEMNLELTVSYAFKSWFFKNYNELEFLWGFTLPDQASVTDFRISYGDTVLKATLLDRWTAELLFSEVSSPVRNPALLTQSFPDAEGQVHYQLRLYPIIRNEKRWFKIQYLIPARPTNETLRLWLPTTQLASRRSPGSDTLHVVFQNPNRPTLLGAEKMNEQYDSPDACWTFDMLLDYDQFVELVYPTPINGRFFFNTFGESGESFYQLAVYPPEVQGFHGPRNFCILVDYNRYNTSGLDGELLLMLLKETMQQALTQSDSASLMVAFDRILSGSDRFLPCTEGQLDRLFTPVLRRAFPAYSYLQPLISSAAAFLKRQANPADVVIFSNTRDIDTWGVTRESLADTIIAMMPAGTRIHVMDLDNVSNPYYYGGQFETNLSSFYGRLCYKTGGNLFFLRYHSIKNMLAALFYENISHFNEVEVQMRFASGYSFGRHLIALHEGYYPLRFPVMQIGRFRGDLPLDLTILGKVRLEKATEQYTIQPGDAVPGDGQLAVAWYGDQVRGLLKNAQGNATVQEIMDISLKHNILTPYTGFLVFRPNENQGYDPTKIESGSNGNQGGSDSDGKNELPTEVRREPYSEPESATPAFTAYPNPFNQRVTLRIQWPRNMDRRSMELCIYDLLGRKVMEIDLPEADDETVVYWDGTTNNGEALPSGIYIAVIRGTDFKKGVKLNMIR